jgi:hypothetical protein
MVPNHADFQLSHYSFIFCTPHGTRTHNPHIKSMVPYSILARRANYFICSPAENRTQLPRLKAECIANNASKEYSVTLVLRSIEGLRFLYLYVLYCFHYFLIFLFCFLAHSTNLKIPSCSINFSFVLYSNPNVLLSINLCIVE